MDSAMIRLISQVALTTWAIAEIAVLLSTRGRVTTVVGTRWAILGLMCFASWMFLTSISIHSAGVIPRADIVLVLALLEAGTAIGAWGWLAANIHARYSIKFKRNGATTEG